MMEFLNMGGYAAYVWSAYGIVAVVLTWNVLSSRKKHKQVLKRLKRLHEDSE